MSDIAGQTVAAEPFEHRFAPLRRVIHPGSLGIEIGPFLYPLAAKRDGYRTLVVDRYDSATLREKAREKGVKPAEIERIEPVDYVGDASRLLDLVRGQGFTGQVDWIVSCHNFEHLPDPIRFLRDCEALLAPGGVLAMIVPDKRACFDRFQPAATAAGILDDLPAGRRSFALVASDYFSGALAGVRVARVLNTVTVAGVECVRAGRGAQGDGSLSAR